MAWRLEKSVIRGELFNLRPNSVHGWLELRGAPSLVHLGLTGNMEGELAGKRVQFETELADEEDEETGGSEEVPEGRAGSPDFEAIEIQQVGPTGLMQLTRAPQVLGTGPEDVRLTLQWFSQLP